ncbi:hypothetical protein P280DRAFT_491521 [Massarina eburnea CBS 473.64]|uniref:Uncharacterized protein n=1 Tax=Massarina eburnea CBS 473.64 TaxID=1395130 RepID=A0A6A6RTU0_9PLEO|nr:hypothetical protein P280DRAFT_491521 [Massarina eburnea CBS 473.64]
MASRVTSVIGRRVLSTSSRSRTALPSQYASSSRSTAPMVVASAATAAMTAVARSANPRLGRVARWYLPAMAAVALGITYLPEQFLYEPSKRSVTLDEANRRINYTMAAQLNQHNTRANPGYAPTQEERNQMMLNSYGDRSSLEDMEKAIAGYEANFVSKTEVEKRTELEEAYGDRTSLHHLKRAMSIYEVQ